MTEGLKHDIFIVDVNKQTYNCVGALNYTTFDGILEINLSDKDVFFPLSNVLVFEVVLHVEVPKDIGLPESAEPAVV